MKLISKCNKIKKESDTLPNKFGQNFQKYVVEDLIDIEGMKKYLKFKKQHKKIYKFMEKLLSHVALQFTCTNKNIKLVHIRRYNSKSKYSALMYNEKVLFATLKNPIVKWLQKIN